MLRCCVLLAALMLVGLTTFEAHADRRVALVIGNSGYREIPALKNPDKDAEDVSKTFRLAGFEVFAAKDLTKLQFEEQFRNYLAAADGADLAVVYYSGHGFQIGGENFLIPVDASLRDAADMEVQAIKVDDILQQLRSKSKIQVIILDACRNDPFPRKDYWLRDQLIVADGTGLAQVTGSQNTLIAFATEPGAVAYDGSGDLSPFSSSFSRRALAPNQEIHSVMAAVRRDVVKATGGKQIPWENSSLIDDVVLMRGVEQPALPPPDAQQNQQVAERKIQVAAAAEAIGNRDIGVPVGVGPVPLKLDLPAKDVPISLKLASYPASGTLSLPNRVLSPQSNLMATEVDQLRYEPQIGQATPVEIGFQIGAGKMSERATLKLSPSVDPCDQAAGEPLDLQGVAHGVLANEIGGGAVEACEAAVQAYPDVARFRYELGRALLAAGRTDDARKAIQEAADKDHIRAVFELGYIAASGIGAVPDPTKANSFYAQAADKGDPYAMTAWGRALFDGVGVQRDTGKGLDLLLKAAAMGHINAMNDLALIFKDGRNGVPADPGRALAFLRAGIGRQETYSMSILGLAGRKTPTVAACKPPKTITKIKVVRIPAPKAPTVTVPIVVKPPQNDTGPAPWRGSGGDHPGPRSGGQSGDGNSGSSNSGSGDTGDSTGGDSSSNF